MLKEYTCPGSVIVKDDETLYSLLTERIGRTGGDTDIAAIKTGPGRWRTITTETFNSAIITAAKGLIALGVGKGDAVTIFSATRFEWGVIDLALAAIGGVNVPVYDTDSAIQAEHIINDAGVMLAFVDNRERYDRLDSVMDDCPTLKRILMFDTNALGVLEGLGVSVSDEEFESRMAAVHTDDLATIVYTSGSTGTPKGVELTHRNFLSVVRAGYICIGEMLNEDNPRLLLFLPLAHCFARYIQYCSIGSDDGVVGYLPDTSSLLPDLRSFRPTYLLGVPRVFEKVYNAASHKAGTGVKGRVFLKAAQAAREWSRLEQAGIEPTAAQRAEHLMYDATVYRQIRGALGPNIRFVACGGAPLDEQLANFFEGVGLPMIQGYGLTETAAPFTVTRAGDHTVGTVGQPAPGSSIRISNSGEVELNGPNIFVRYHNQPEATAEAFTPDGWFKTGDLGAIDNEGRLRITGRAKDIIITAGGKNVSPIPLEQGIAQCPIVEHAVVIGDGKPFIAALVTLDPEGLSPWLAARGLNAQMPLEAAADLPQVREEIQGYVDRANASVSRAESVRKFAVLPEQLTQENGCLTASMKVVRAHVAELFAPVIEELYTPGRS